MGIEYGTGHAARLKEREAQQHRVAHARPDGIAHITVQGNVLHQYRVDGNTYNDKERLEAQGKQAAQVVLTHLAPLVVHHSCHGDRGQRCDQIYLNHSPECNNENADHQRPHGHAHKEGLEPQAEQRPQVHLHQPGLQVCGHAGYVDGGVSYNNAGGVIHHTLRQVKDPHHNVPGVGDDEDCAGGFENPLEEHRAFNVVKVILIYNELDQLQRHHDGQNHPGYGHHDRLRKVLDHAEKIAVPRLGGKSDLLGDLTDLLVDRIEHAGQVAHNAADQNLFQPVSEDLYDKIQG